MVPKLQYNVVQQLTYFQWKVVEILWRQVKLTLEDKLIISVLKAQIEKTFSQKVLAGRQVDIAIVMQLMVSSMREVSAFMIHAISATTLGQSQSFSRGQTSDSCDIFAH